MTQLIQKKPGWEEGGRRVDGPIGGLESPFFLSGSRSKKEDTFIVHIVVDFRAADHETPAVFGYWDAKFPHGCGSAATKTAARTPDAKTPTPGDRSGSHHWLIGLYGWVHSIFGENIPKFLTDRGVLSEVGKTAQVQVRSFIWRPTTGIRVGKKVGPSIYPWDH